MLPAMSKLEHRVAALERRLAAVESKSPDNKPAWLKHVGWAKDDPVYDEAMKLGAEWRKRENRKPPRNARRR